MNRLKSFVNKKRVFAKDQPVCFVVKDQPRISKIRVAKLYLYLFLLPSCLSYSFVRTTPMDFEEASYIKTATDNPSKPKILSLKDPQQAKEKIDTYFQSWDNREKKTCFPMPFCTNYNKPCYQTEKRLFDYVTNLRDQPMLVINSFQHNTSHEIGHTGVCEEENVKSKIEPIVDELDLLVVHRDFGLLLFEVKEMKEVEVIPKKQEEDRCPMVMINKAQKQLTKRWNEIETYLRYFFRDKIVKETWRKYFEMETCDEIDAMMEKIIEKREMRSFICLFGWNQLDEATKKRIMFSCKRTCSDPKHVESLHVSNCQVLTDKELENDACFQSWWNGYFSKGELQSDMKSYELLLNRFGLDFYLSEWIYKYVDIHASVKAIEKETETVKGIFENNSKSQVSKKVKLLWDKTQKEALLQAELAFILGAPGSGKTIVMVEKVRCILKKINVKEIEDRILIITGKNEALKNMLQNCKEYLKSSREEIKNAEKLFIFTLAEFRRWYEDRVQSNENARFRHIFLDECQDLDEDDLTDLLNNNLSLVDENRHFWILRGGSQNRSKHTNDQGINPNLSQIWYDPKNYFSTFYLRYVFRSTQRQFQSFLPFMKKICCSKCKKEKELAGFDRKIVCHFCQIWHGVDTLGPETLYLPLLNVDEHHENVAEKLMHAIVKGWETFKTEKKCETIQEQIIRLCNDGIFEKTTIITDPNNVSIAALSKQLENHLYQCGVTCTVGPAKEFYEQDDGKRRTFLRMDSYLGFKGLESTLVIIYDPFVCWEKMDLQKIGNYVVSFSRATCLNVVVTTEAGKKDLSEAFNESNSPLRQAMAKLNEKCVVELHIEEKLQLFQCLMLLQRKC